MLSVDESLKLVLGHAQTLLPVPALQADVRGRVLAEAIISDIDSPPHDKSIVDGYALIAADVTPGKELLVLEEVTAGTVPTRVVEPGTAIRIMTGAPLPHGADAVVMVEQTTLSGDRVQISRFPVRAGQNIMRKAASLARGEVVLQPGKVMRAIEIGLLAEVGRETVQVVPQPQVAVIATGNELVSAGSVPGPGQIRNSNGPLLQGLIGQAGGMGIPLGIARDDAADLKLLIALGLKRDVLLLSGGVSAGVLDLVPEVLVELGVEQVFHKVNLKPGKPLWFGVKRHADSGRQTLVFGLPGNPVSGLVCFELFVRPAIEKLSGRDPRGLARINAKLTQDHQQRGDRPTFWPAVLDREGQPRAVTPLPWKGSGDLRTLTEANCLAYFPSGDCTFRAGDNVEALQLDCANDHRALPGT
jgi:molybdopterin molybdotransferase